MMKKHGTGETAPGPGVRAGSPDLPGAVRRGQVTSLLPGRGLQGLGAEFQGSGRFVGDTTGHGRARG